MNQLSSYATKAEMHIVVESHELLIDHRLMRRLLNRFDFSDTSNARAEIMDLAARLFRSHSSIEAQLYQPGSPQLETCRAVACVVSRIRKEGSYGAPDLRSDLDLKKEFEESLLDEESMIPVGKTFYLRCSRTNSLLLTKHAELVDQAVRILRVH